LNAMPPVVDLACGAEEAAKRRARKRLRKVPGSVSIGLSFA
jgi:hypothetical protein